MSPIQLVLLSTTTSTPHPTRGTTKADTHDILVFILLPHFPQSRNPHSQRTAAYMDRPGREEVRDAARRCNSCIAFVFPRLPRVIRSRLRRHRLAGR
jgi:hypothetical protein